MQNKKAERKVVIGDDRLDYDNSSSGTYRSGVSLTIKTVKSRQAEPDLHFYTPHSASGHPLPQGAREQKRGFTLIELLVVVLIIGILAAVSVPQYQKAVLKARMTEMQTIVRKIYDAKQVYKLANGKDATSFEELDLDFGSNYSNAITYVKNRFRCELWGSCANAIAIRDIKFYISLYGNPAQWGCCWGGENKKIQKACQSYFPNGEYVPNAPQMGFENEQCIRAPF